MKKTYFYGISFIFFIIFIATYFFVSNSFSAENTQQQDTTQGITIPQELHSGDVLPAIEWNKVRQALIDLNKKTG